MQEHQQYLQEKQKAVQFISEHYDAKSAQLLFYPRTNKRHATQPGRFWKDTDEVIPQEQPILKPYESTFEADQ